MEYGDTDSIDSTEGKVTTLFEKDFTLRVPGSTDGFAVVKSGKINADTITWTVKVTAPDNVDYGGYTFTDNLEKGLEYIEGTRNYIRHQDDLNGYYNQLIEKEAFDAGNRMEQIYKWLTNNNDD